MKAPALITITTLLCLLVAQPVRAQCTSDEQCKGSRRCLAGVCRDAACSVDTDCPGQSICNAGHCSVQLTAAPIKRERITALWLTGAIAFAAVYVATIATTAATCDDSTCGKATGYAAIPLLGPLPLMLDDGLYLSGGQVAAATLSLILQLGSAATLIVGLAYKRPVSASANNERGLAVGPLLTPDGGRGLLMSWRY